MTTVFCCPHCGQPLERDEHRFFCPGGHSFDIAREGYVNLLPANKRHSSSPGDDRDMVAARADFLSGGWFDPLRDELCRLVKDLNIAAPVLLDAGCGEGYYTSALCAAVAAAGGLTAGVDLSKAAVRRAAKRCPDAQFAIASVYRLPLAGSIVDVLVNCFSPLADGEFARVLRPGGYFFYVVPGPRHLWEMKTVLYDVPYENEEKTVQYPGFEFLGASPVETAFTLDDNSDIMSLFRMTPYAWKTPKSGVDRLSAVSGLRVTAQFRIHVYRRLSCSGE